MFSIAVPAAKHCEPLQLWTWIARNASSSLAFAASAITVAIGTIVFVIAGGRSTAILAAGGFLFGSGSSGLNMLLWSLFADQVAERRQIWRKLAPTVAFAVLTSVIKAASAASIVVVSQILVGLDYHNAKAATSWSLTGPMAGCPLLGAAVCFFAAPYLWGPKEQGRRRDKPTHLWPRRVGLQT